MNPDNKEMGERLLSWLLLVVKVGTLVAVFWYGIAEYRRWARKQKRKD
jgi:hypothetical protein